jgi:hypothetical protein
MVAGDARITANSQARWRAVVNQGALPLEIMRLAVSTLPATGDSCVKYPAYTDQW